MLIELLKTLVYNLTLPQNNRSTTSSTSCTVYTQTVRSVVFHLQVIDTGRHAERISSNWYLP